MYIQIERIVKHYKKYTPCSSQPVHCKQHPARGQLTFAGLDALRVIKDWLADISTFVEPRTAGSATTVCVGFLDGAALGLHGTDFRCGQCRCGRRYYNGL